MKSIYYNGISIDGKLESWFTDDTHARFKAYNWQVIGQIDGHDPLAIEEAIEQAHQDATKPTIIICKTIIGFGSTVADREKYHGSPLGSEALAQTRKILQWSHPPFEIPDALYAKWNHLEQGQHEETQWLQCCKIYQQKYPGDYHEFFRRISGKLPNNSLIESENFIEQCQINEKALATRKSSQLCIEQFAKLLPEMLGGSADLTSSNNTDWSGTKAITATDFSGN